MKNIVLSLLFFNLSVIGLSQDLYNPELIEKLNVKCKTVISSGSKPDTSVYKYDIEGRLIYKKYKKYGENSVDSIIYKKNIIITKMYSATGILKCIVTQNLDKKGNIIRFERNQFLPVADINGYESTYKKGELVSTRSFRNDKVIYTWNKKDQIETDSIIYYENDTTYSYLLNNPEVVFFNDENNKPRELGAIAFDDKGNIIWSSNYINNKPNEVTVITRNYDVENKTFTESISKEYYFPNGLKMKTVDFQNGGETIYIYEYYQ